MTSHCKYTNKSNKYKLKQVTIQKAQHGNVVMYSCDDVASCGKILLKGRLCDKNAQILSKNKPVWQEQRLCSGGVYTACIYVMIGVGISITC